ncbi:MAG: hypothetical protein K1W19_14200 [Lachnospiraceae bacterium]
MSKIYAPVKDYNGISAGVSFRDGVGETSSPYLLKWFREHGYEVEETQEFTEDNGLNQDSGEDESLEETRNSRGEELLEGDRVPEEEEKSAETGKRNRKSKE